MPKCPFCGAGFSPRAIMVSDERFIDNGTSPDEEDYWEFVEAYQCYCGAWWYEGMPDVSGDFLGGA